MTRSGSSTAVSLNGRTEGSFDSTNSDSRRHTQKNQPRGEGKRRDYKSRKEPTLAPSAPKKEILISIDYGTTKSCAAVHVLRSDLDPEVLILNSTPGDDGCKVPTRVKHEEGGSFAWGTEVKVATEDDPGFKMFLDSTGRHWDGGGDSSDDRVKIQRGMDLTRMFLARFLKLINNTISDRFGIGDWDKKYYIMTFPNYFSELARLRIRNCASDAGMALDLNFQMITEAQAAGEFSLRKALSGTIETGQTYVICDAGGGTVDVETYQVESIGESTELTLIGGGGGAPCGSASINRQFRSKIEETLAKDTAFTDRHMDDVCNAFEKQKIEFDGEKVSEVGVVGSFSHDDLKVQNGYITLSKEDMKEYFAPFIEGTVALVRQQIEECAEHRPKAVVLVGGSGQSLYLAKVLRNAFPGIAIIRPPRGSTAVVEGALLIRKNEIENGYHPSLRPSRLHIGCDMTRTFDEKRDRKRKQRSFHDDFYNEKSVRVVDWIIPLGKMIKEGSLASDSFEAIVDDEERKVTRRFYICRNQVEQAPDIETDRRIELLCEINLELPPNPYTHTSEGKRCRHFDCVIKVLKDKITIQHYHYDKPIHSVDQQLRVFKD